MLQTPDLSKEFHPVPKVYKAKKPRQSLSTLGKKGTEWKDAREQLKETFAKHGITECELRYEGCWKNTALGFAHRDKRVHLQPDELTVVILACNPCHQQIEQLPRKEMAKIVDDTIAKREFL